MRRDIAAMVYCVCSWSWGAACIVGCSWLVFYEGHSGWWFLLAILLGSNPTAQHMRRIMGEKVDDE